MNNQTFNIGDEVEIINGDYSTEKGFVVDSRLFGVAVSYSVAILGAIDIVSFSRVELKLIRPYSQPDTTSELYPVGTRLKSGSIILEVRGHTHSVYNLGGEIVHLSRKYFDDAGFTPTTEPTTKLEAGEYSIADLEKKIEEMRK